MRADWDEYFMNIARVVATRATCERAQVGCVIVQDRRIVATGYNGSIAGQAHCNDEGHLEINGECVRGIHAEENAVTSAAKFGATLNGATAYVTHFPCWRCFRTLASAGISRIVFDILKYNNLTLPLFKEIDKLDSTGVLTLNHEKGLSWKIELVNLIKERESAESK